MYHSISQTDENKIFAYYHTNTSPSLFAEHMKYLYVNKYTIITINDAINILEHVTTGEMKKREEEKKYVEHYKRMLDYNMEDENVD